MIRACNYFTAAFVVSSSKFELWIFYFLIAPSYFSLNHVQAWCICTTMFIKILRSMEFLLLPHEYPTGLGTGLIFSPVCCSRTGAPVAVRADKPPLALPTEPYGVDADTKFLIMVEMCFYKFLLRLWKCCEMCACF